jgi:hypothetical protein
MPEYYSELVSILSDCNNINELVLNNNLTSSDLIEILVTIQGIILYWLLIV